MAAYEGHAGRRPAGIASIVELPRVDWSHSWDRVYCDEKMKSVLLNFTLFSLGMRREVDPVAFPTHGLAIISGPPGTGKTTLARGLANLAISSLGGDGGIFVMVDPHALPSELLGGSQQAASRLMERTIPDLARDGRPVVVLLDEAEGLAVNRWEVTGGANPVDVQRVTEAVLVGIDYIASECKNVVFIATSNKEDSLDPAFCSRADIIVRMPLPSVEVVARILVDTVSQLNPAPSDSALVLSAAEECVREGLDGRQVRKVILRTVLSDSRLAQTPELLTIGDVLGFLNSDSRVLFAE